MTTGSPLRKMMLFAIPLLIGNIAQVAYNFTDSLIVSRMVGLDAMAAIGASAPIQQLFFVFFMAVGTGVSVTVAQYFGAKDFDRLSRAIGTSIAMTGVVTVFITLAGIPLSLPLLKLIQTDVTIRHDANMYLIIIFAGTIGQGYYNILSGALRGMGDSIFPLIVLACTSVLNIALDFLFISLGMGVFGAGLATSICQYISAISVFNPSAANDAVYYVFTGKSVADAGNDKDTVANRHSERHYAGDTVGELHFCTESYQLDRGIRRRRCCEFHDFRRSKHGRKLNRQIRAASESGVFHGGQYLCRAEHRRGRF